MSDMPPKLETWAGVRARMPRTLRIFTLFEFIAQWIFFILKSSAALRLSLEIVAVGAILAGVWGLLADLEQRKIDRGVRIASLFAQIAEVRALPDGVGLNALRPSVEALVRDGVPINRLDLRCVDLSGADLRGAYLSGANLTGVNVAEANLAGANLAFANMKYANLFEAGLQGADLEGAILSFTDMNFTDLRGAYLFGAVLNNADITAADFSSAQELYQDQLDEGCVHENSGIFADKPFSAPSNICTEDRTYITSIEACLRKTRD